MAPLIKSHDITTRRSRDGQSPLGEALWIGATVCPFFSPPREGSESDGRRNSSFP